VLRSSICSTLGPRRKARSDRVGVVAEFAVPTGTRALALIEQVLVALAFCSVGGSLLRMGDGQWRSASLDSASALAVKLMSWA
jgi:hypothetical protein